MSIACRRIGARRLTHILLAGALALVAFGLIESSRTQAQLPPTEEQALAVERQLLCPICTNERLDVCSTAICQDMKRIIRERLAAGSSPDDIILYFETRYGPKVRAELEPSGFNLWLYGWIGASTLAIAGIGGWFLLGLRRRSTPAAATTSRGAPPAEDDAWLDAQIADDDDRER
jgi:cytochrome c-type biogenesis protein CcmH/NrfF